MSGAPRVLEEITDGTRAGARDGGHVMRTYVRRLVGALALDPAAYEDVEADSGATLAAGLTVVLSSVATAIGAQGLGQNLSQVPTFALVTLVGWMAWALVTFEVGARLLPGARTHADVGE